MAAAYNKTVVARAGFFGGFTRKPEHSGDKRLNAVVTVLEAVVNVFC